MAQVIYANTKNADMFYQVKMHIPDPFFYLYTKGKSYIFLDKREIDAFKEKNQNTDLEAIAIEPLIKQVEQMSGSEKGFFKLAYLIFKEYDLLDQQVEVPASFPLDLADYLRSKKIDLVVKNPFYPGRIIKTKQEIDYIKECNKKTVKAFEKIEEILKDSEVAGEQVKYQDEILTCEYLKKEVEKVLLDQGMMLTEGLIISTGYQSAMPHHRGHGSVLANQPLICDIFPQDKENGYYADITRTFLKGQATPEFIKMYQAVFNAQQAALDIIKPGLTGQEIHQQAVKVFEEAGFDVGDEKGFMHGTGHGFGLEVHEGPTINRVSEDIIKEDQVFTIEPGLYYPELGGVRIEDNIVVTKDGYQNLTDFPKELNEL